MDREVQVARQRLVQRRHARARSTSGAASATSRAGQRADRGGERARGRPLSDRVGHGGALPGREDNSTRAEAEIRLAGGRARCLPRLPAVLRSRHANGKAHREGPGGARGRAERGAPPRPPGDRRRAPRARAARAAGGDRRARSSRRSARSPSLVASRVEDELRTVPKVAGARALPREPAREAHRPGRGRGEAAQGRVRLDRAPPARRRRGEDRRGRGAPRVRRDAGPHPRRAAGRPRRRARHLARGGEPVPRAREVREGPHRARARRASSTRWSAATTRSGASSRSSPAARRTTRCSSATPASARPRSSRGSRGASWTATCRRG